LSSGCRLPCHSPPSPDATPQPGRAFCWAD
jgi:hypothetical protein